MPLRTQLTVVPDNPVEAFMVLEEVRSYADAPPSVFGLGLPLGSRIARELGEIYMNNLRKKFFPSFPGSYTGENL